MVKLKTDALHKYYSIRLSHPEKSIKYWLGHTTFAGQRVLRIVRRRKDAIAWKQRQYAFANLYKFPSEKYAIKLGAVNPHRRSNYRDILTDLGYTQEVVEYYSYSNEQERSLAIFRYRQNNPVTSFRPPKDVAKFIRQQSRTGENNSDTIIRLLRERRDYQEN